MMLGVPMVWVTGGIALTEAPALLMATISLLAAVFALTRVNGKRALCYIKFLTSGTFAGLAIIGRQTYLPILIGFALMCYHRERMARASLSGAFDGVCRVDAGISNLGRPGSEIASARWGRYIFRSWFTCLCISCSCPRHNCASVFYRGMALEPGNLVRRGANEFCFPPLSMESGNRIVQGVTSFSRLLLHQYRRLHAPGNASGVPYLGRR